MDENNIEIRLELDEQKIPRSISWAAHVNGEDKIHQAKAMLLAFWDGADKSAMRLDLWTAEMMVDEMADFFYQTLQTMADTYQRATHYADQADEMKAFAKDFLHKYREKEKAGKAF